MNQIVVSTQDDYSETFKTFCDINEINHVIGFSGGADEHIDGIPRNDPLQVKYVEYHQALHERIIFDSLKPLQGCRIAILTGGTKWGIPRTANKIARDLGFKTIGVTPKAGAHHALDSEHLDLQFIVNPLLGPGFWGDEGALWTALVDAILVIGGGAGTLTECAHLMKINETLVKNDLPTKFMIPIHGTGGLAEQLPHLWAKQKIRDVSMPNVRVNTGSQAANILLSKFDFEYKF